MNSEEKQQKIKEFIRLTPSKREWCVRANPAEACCMILWLVQPENALVIPTFWTERG